MPAEIVTKNDHFVATAELRFVRRTSGPGQTSFAGWLRILQQRWVMVGIRWGADLDATNSEWRDVPLVEEGV